MSPFENPKTLNISIFNDVPMYGAWCMGKTRGRKVLTLSTWYKLSTCTLVAVICLFAFVCLKQKRPPPRSQSIQYSLITSYSFAIYPEHLKEMDYCILQNLMVKDLHVWVLLDHQTPTRQCEQLQKKLQDMSVNIQEWSDAYWE